MNNNNKGIIITQTPFRVSFFGGGTDFPEYFNKHSSVVIGTTIDKFMYVTLNSLERFFEKRIRFSYSSLENVGHPSELEHKLAGHILEDHPFLDDSSFLDANTFADLPASSGIGSSSVFTVGMLNALYLLNGVYKKPVDIAKEAIYIEREKLKDVGGWQDQVFASFGGFNKITFADNDFIVEPICIDRKYKDALESSCLMFFTGNTRSSSDIQKEVLKTSGEDKLSCLKQIKLLADKAYDVIYNACDPDELVQEFGRLLHESWMFKRNLSEGISDNTIDSMYDIGLKAGALGGKLCGAGGGGFLLFVVPEDKKESVKDALKGYKQLDIKFSNYGSHSIYSKD